MKLSLGKTTWLLLQSFLQVKVAVKCLVGLNMLSPSLLRIVLLMKICCFFLDALASLAFKLSVSK